MTGTNLVSTRFIGWRRVECSGGCGTYVWMKHAKNGYCRKCAKKIRLAKVKKELRGRKSSRRVKMDNPLDESKEKELGDEIESDLRRILNRGAVKG